MTVLLHALEPTRFDLDTGDQAGQDGEGVDDHDREDSMYRQDHLKVLRVLGEDVPETPTYRVSEIVVAGFRRAEDADRRVRNAMRKLRSDDLVEIAERGKYRLRPEGVKFVQAAKEKGWPSTPKRAKSVEKDEKPSKKGTGAKEKRTKKAKTPKKSAKEEVQETQVKVVEVPPTAPETAQAPIPDDTGGNGVNDQDSGSESQLSW